MTAIRADRHSRMVAWLKVALPLAALGLLSTLFMLSRAIDPEAAIPFADKEIQDRLRDQQVTAPFFSGTSADGDQLSFQAAKLTKPDGQVGANEAQDVRAEFISSGGTRIVIQSDIASFDIAQDLAELRGNVRFETSTGYQIMTDFLTSQMSSFRVDAPGSVLGNGPLGQLEAGSMSLKLPNGENAAQLIFTNGVKLVYTPKQETK